MDERTRKRVRWAATAAVVLSVLLLAGCCCPRPIALGPAHRFPSREALELPVPPGLNPSDTVSEASMRNILFHLDDDIHLHIHQLRGRMHDLRGSGIILLDDKNTLLLEIRSGVMGMSSGDLSLLMNRYVFGYPGSPLRNLRVRMAGTQMVQTGVMHNIVDIPFEMTANLSVTPQGMIRISPTAMKICGVDGFGMLRMLHVQMEDLLDLSGAKGVRMQGNDMYLDPLVILPPPRIAGRLTGLRVEGDELVQIFGDGDHLEPSPPPSAAENYLYFRGGTLRFGKLLMAGADLQAVDADPGDPFDFYLDHYQAQLVAGYHLTTPVDGMLAFFPDFADLGTPEAARHPRAITRSAPQRDASAAHR
jgi:hypothetical protein